MSNGEERVDSDGGPLEKSLGLGDVFSISTGAMFSSGFFLLPGIAVASAGPSAVVAYFLAGLLMIPATLSMLELSTALPKAGGAYYFIDRSLGPAAGTVAGIGTWLSLVLKSSFALVGMGAYLAITPGIGEFFEVGTTSTIWFMKGLAVVLTVLFVVINLYGAKETTRLQKLLVAGLLAVLALFVVKGIWHVSTKLPEDQLLNRYRPFLHEEKGWHGLFGTIGLVFVSYAGLTKVASVSEEVRQPERNLPLGLFLSLTTATVMYVLGTFVVVAILGPEQLVDNYAPIGVAAAALDDWLPGTAMLILVILAAIAAFLSTGNAGILAAGRYPLAMARDHLMPDFLGKVGQSGTPSRGIVVTGAVMIVFILALPLQDVAKLGSTFNLLVFGLVNLAVIVMRESRIEGYDPSFRVIFYPWLPILGILISSWLIFEMGWLSISFSVGVMALSLIWYRWYAQPLVDRAGAIHHVFARLGRYQHQELQAEFRQIIKEKGLREEDPYDVILQRAPIIELEDESFDEVVYEAAKRLTEDQPISADALMQRMLKADWYEGSPVSNGAALLHVRSSAVDGARMVLARSKSGVCVDVPPEVNTETSQQSCGIDALFFLVSREDEAAQHFRIIAELSKRTEDSSFMEAWRHLEGHQRLKELLLRDAGFMELFIGEEAATERLVGSKLGDLELPSGASVVMIRRDGKIFEPSRQTRLQYHDYVILIGEPEAIDQLSDTYIEAAPQG